MIRLQSHFVNFNKEFTKINQMSYKRPKGHLLDLDLNYYGIEEKKEFIVNNSTKNFGKE
jgi:hypothetical protein